MDELNPSDASLSRSPAVRLRGGRLAVVVLSTCAIAIGLFASSLAVGGGRRAAALPPVNSGPALVAQDQLERLAASTAQPIYWAGPKSGYSYELTRTSSGRIYVRYLPSGVAAGDPRPDFLVVGTYEQPGSFAYLQHASSNPKSVALDIGNGGIALFDSAHPSSVYFAYPRAPYQVEVYDPSGSASRLVLAGTIRPLR